MLCPLSATVSFALSNEAWQTLKLMNFNINRPFSFQINVFMLNKSFRSYPQKLSVLLRPGPTVSALVDQRWGPRVCISDKFSGNSDAACLGSHFENYCSRTRKGASLKVVYIIWNLNPHTLWNSQPIYTSWSIWWQRGRERGGAQQAGHAERLGFLLWWWWWGF